MDNYIFRNAENKSELNQIEYLFNQVFYPEKVGELAKIITQHLPGMNFKNWFITEDKSSNEIVSGFVLIPWQWQLLGINLKVAEMGIVGTAKSHRNKGLFKQNNESFQEALISEQYDLSVIQGIPGIYHRLGYQYAIPLEHHTQLPLYAISNEPNKLNFRLAHNEDIPYLIEEGKKHNSKHGISVLRSYEHWNYVFTEGKNTEYSCEVYIVKCNDTKYYIKLLQQGFGQGLIVSEASCDIPFKVLNEMLLFLKKEAKKRNKPYIRLNLPNTHCLVRHALNYEACIKPSYAWQVKILDIKRFLEKLSPAFESRIEKSVFKGINTTLTLNLYTQQFVMHFNNGLLKAVSNEAIDTAEHIMSIPEDVLPLLFLGHRTWRELQFNRPDIFPGDQHLRMDLNHPSEETGCLVDVLFPKMDNWVYCQY